MASLAELRTKLGVMVMVGCLALAMARPNAGNQMTRVGQRSIHFGYNMTSVSEEKEGRRL